MVTVRELIASTWLPDVSKGRLQQVMQQLGYGDAEDVDDTMRWLTVEDVAKVAGQAGLDPPLIYGETWTLLFKIWLAGPGLPVPQAVTAFAAHIKSGGPFPEGWYELPDDLLLLGSEAFGSKLKIRQAYADLFEFLQSVDASGRLALQQVEVSGNPGVGKSMFLVYYLLRLLHGGKAVLWHAPANHQSAIYYYITPSHSGARVQHVTEEVAKQLLTCEERVYYAVDGAVPFMPLAFRWAQAVVAASPNADDCRRFLRIHPSTVVPITLPLWQQDEVLDLRRVAHAGMPEQQASERLAKRNGIPRAIFDDVSDKEVSWTLADVDFEALIELQAIPETPFEAHPLVVFSPTRWHQWRDIGLSAFLRRQAQYASQWVRRLATAHFANKTAQYIQAWLPANKCWAGNLSPARRAELLEDIAHFALAFGHKLPFRHLVKAGKGWEQRAERAKAAQKMLDLGKLRQEWFNSPDELSNLQLRQYAMPYSNNRGDTDSLTLFPLNSSDAWVAYLWHIRVSKAHSISKALFKVLDSLPTKVTRIVLCFVVTSEVFDDHWKLLQQMPDTTGCSPRVVGLMQTLEQGVLLLPDEVLKNPAPSVSSSSPTPEPDLDSDSMEQ